MNIVKLSDSEFATIVDFMYKSYGINLLKKRVLIEGRMAGTLRGKKLSSYSEYIDLLFSDNSGDEITHFINRITTNHTFFMREMEHFRFLSDVVLPQLDSQRYRELRIWSAGCATGQEPYTISMTVNDYLREHNRKWNVKILATDISVEARQKAEKGIYSDTSLKNMPAEWKNNYFINQRDESYRVVDEIKRPIRFETLNLNEEFAFTKPFNIIFCRNVMIYFDDTTRERLINRFYNVTADDGFLFVGHSEVVNRRATDFKYVMPAIYQKVGD